MLWLHFKNMEKIKSFFRNMRTKIKALLGGFTKMGKKVD
jgi:hypothetical protein